MKPFRNLRILIILFFVVLSINSPVFSQIKITAFPDNYVYIFEESRKDGIYNFLIHNIGIINNSGFAYTLDHITIQQYKNKNVAQENNFTADEIVKTSSTLYQLQEAKQLEQYEFLFRTRDIVQQAKISNSSQLNPNTSLVLRRLFFTGFAVPDSIVIRTTGRVKNKKSTVVKTLLVKDIQSASDFIFPVKGNWFVQAGPSAHTHHRWGYMEEFAYDINKVGNDNLTYTGDYKTLANYYAFGKDVLSIADGVVEEVMNDIDEAEIYPKDLAQDKYMQLLRERQTALIKNFGMKGIGGNYIIIRHSSGVYSFYGHLKKGSVKVKAGDKVLKGQVIGAIGNSGNSTEPHLHFQVNETKDVLNSRSIPIRFSNINWSESFEPEGSYIKSGEIVQTKN